MVPPNILNVLPTESWQRVLPPSILARYDVFETRNAAAILEATNRPEFCDVVAVLDEFTLTREDVLAAGGNETGIAARLNAGFRSRGWREEQAETTVTMRLLPRGAGEEPLAQLESTQTGYFIDNVKGRVALDVEWNAKDGNLDRDLGMYRTLYDSGFVDVAVMITREHAQLRDWGQALRSEAGQTSTQIGAWLGTTTTTNLEKLRQRVDAGGAGGCPFLAVAITKRT